MGDPSIRGLRDFCQLNKVDVYQEFKLEIVKDFTFIILGGSYIQNWEVKKATGSSGGTTTWWKC